MSIKIDKGVPIPKARVNYRNILPKMNVGDSILVPSRGPVFKYKKEGYTFQTAAENDKYRVWLISKPTAKKPAAKKKTAKKKKATAKKKR